MRIVVLLLAVASAAFGSVQDRTAKQPFRIDISAAAETVKVGSGVDITIVLKNVSAAPLSCSANISELTGQDPNLQFDVRDNRGHLIPKRVYPHPELAQGNAILNCAIKPGKSRTDHQDIGRIYDMTRPGKYIVQVSRPISYTDKKAGVVKSNKVTITVVR